MNRIEATGLTKIPLCRQGENLARQVSFSPGFWNIGDFVGAAPQSVSNYATIGWFY